jgi:hypothetical protein
VSDRRFPVLYGYPQKREDDLLSVPWDMLAHHAAQAWANHHQTLERLAERGGLGLGEMVAVLEDRPWRPMHQRAAAERLRELVAAYEVMP